jgi:hypothetical protein
MINNPSLMIDTIYVVKADTIDGSFLGGLTRVWFHEDGIDVSTWAKLRANTGAEDVGLYADLERMAVIAPIVKSGGGTGNTYQMALAFDDLVLTIMNAPGSKYSPTTKDDISRWFLFELDRMFVDNPVFRTIMSGYGMDEHNMPEDYYDIGLIMLDKDGQLAVNFMNTFNAADGGRAGQQLAIANIIARNQFADQMMEDFMWVRYRNQSNAWGGASFASISDPGNISVYSGGFDTRLKNKYVVGATISAASIDAGGVDGSVFSIAGYGTKRLDGMNTAVYAKAGMSFNSFKVYDNHYIAGDMKSDSSSIDLTVESGLMHRIYDRYVSGRLFGTAGMFGGFDLTKKTQQGEFMNIKSPSEFGLSAGYELSFGKDIYPSQTMKIRPFAKVGVEYELLGRAVDTKFQFVGADKFRNWTGEEIKPLWLRYGAGVDFAMQRGIQMSIGYDIIDNGEWSAGVLKINGRARF